MPIEEYFKVTGLLNGEHQIEMEDATRLSLNDAALARMEKTATRLQTNDPWPNRPESVPAPGAFPDAGGTTTQVLIEFASLTGKVVQLANDLKLLGTAHNALADEKEALEERVVALENALDAKIEAAKVEADKKAKPS